MKKIALLLGALSLVSSVAYAKEVVPAVEEVTVVEEVPVEVVAAPALRVTSIGQYIEVDNDSGSSDIGETVFFGNTVGLAYGDNWTFGLLAAKMWNIDTDDGIHGNNHRLQLDAWRHFENISLGLRWRGQETYDRYYLRTKYSYGAFSGWIDAVYQSNNGDDTDHEDQWYSEAEPIMVTFGPVTLGYYYEWNKMINDRNDGYEGDLAQELRVKVPLYTGEKLTLGAEYRWQFDMSRDYDSNAKGYNKGFNKDGKLVDYDSSAHKIVLTAAYAFTENFTVDGYYRYDFNEHDSNVSGVKDPDDNYYGEFYVGWTYTF